MKYRPNICISQNRTMQQLLAMTPHAVNFFFFKHANAKRYYVMGTAVIIIIYCNFTNFDKKERWVLMKTMLLSMRINNYRRHFVYHLFLTGYPACRPIRCLHFPLQ
jgi:hypothetical protein